VDGQGRVLGVDIGTVRVGLALSDTSRTLASPLGTLDVPPGSADDAWVSALAVRLATVAAEQACDAVVVGLPRALSGGETATTTLVRRVVDALRRQDVRVEVWDERFSSVEAERVLIGAGRRRDRRRNERDRIAATIILQGWLDSRAR
jgi:putative Holliday junction resolvase